MDVLEGCRWLREGWVGDSITATSLSPANPESCWLENGCRDCMNEFVLLCYNAIRKRIQPRNAFWKAWTIVDNSPIIELIMTQFVMGQIRLIFFKLKKP